MKKSRRRRNVVVKEVSLVDHPATRKTFVFFKSDNAKEVKDMEKELEFVNPDKGTKTEATLESLKEENLGARNLVKNSINNLNRVLSEISKSAGYKYYPQFKAIEEETALEEAPDNEGPAVDEVVGAFDSVYGEGAATVKGVFQGLATVVSQMAESVGFKASMTFSKEEAPPEEAPPEDTPPADAGGDQEHGDDDPKKKKEDDDEELTESEKVLCDELEQILEELSQPDITPERYMEILARKGAIEDKLKGGDKNEKES